MILPHLIVRCSCGAILSPCPCMAEDGTVSSDFDPHHVDIRDGACAACLNGTRPVVVTTPLDLPTPSRFGNHDMDNVVDMDPKEPR